jgi:hypothetical protein
MHVGKHFVINLCSTLAYIFLFSILESFLQKFAEENESENTYLYKNMKCTQCRLRGS